MEPNGEDENSVTTAAPVEDRPVLRSRASKGEDVGAVRDRERPRPGTGQTRPTLGAVGRVASRVRTSGISKISTLLPKGREDGDVSSSPWGVGTAALPRSQSTSVIPDSTAQERIDEITKSPKQKRKSDVFEVSSPVSADGADQGKVANLAEKKDRVAPIGNLLDRQASSAVKSKFAFRPSVLVEPKSPSNALVESKGLKEAASGVSKDPKRVTSGGVKFQTVEEANDADVGIDAKNVSISAPVVILPENNSKNMSSSKVTFVSESVATYDSDIADPARDVEKSRILNFAGFVRGRGRTDAQKRRSKAEKPRGVLGLSRSRSQFVKPGNQAEAAVEEDSDIATLRSRKSEGPGGRTAGRFSKQHSGNVKGKKTSWFSLLIGDHGGDRGTKQDPEMKGRGRSKKQEEKRVSVGPDFFAKAAACQKGEAVNATRVDLLSQKRKDDTRDVKDSGRSFEKVAVVAAEEFVGGSDEEAGEVEKPVRSLVVDDFISYQTKKGKKGK